MCYVWESFALDAYTHSTQCIAPAHAHSRTRSYKTMHFFSFSFKFLCVLFTHTHTHTAPRRSTFHSTIVKFSNFNKHFMIVFSCRCWTETCAPTSKYKETKTCLGFSFFRLYIPRQMQQVNILMSVGFDANISLASCMCVFMAVWINII